MTNRSIAVVAFLLLTTCAVVSSQALAPGPSSAYAPSAMGPATMGPAAMGPSSPSDECLTKVLNMSDCLSYVTVGSNVTKPDEPCCPELAGLVDSNPICLCELLGKNNSYGLSIDLNRALKLPYICGVKTPPVDLCSVAGIPVGVPVGGPTASVGEGPGVHPPARLAASPPAGNNDSGASSSNAGSVLTILLGLAFVYLI